MKAGLASRSDIRRPAPRSMIYDRPRSITASHSLELDQLKAARSILIAAPAALLLWSSLLAFLF